MGQKTHPLGFRFGTDAKSVELGYSNKDLHGISARWAVNNSGNVNRYAEQSQKDNQIRTLIKNRMDEDGFIVNKCIIHRSTSLVGVYVDAYEIEEITAKNNSILEDKSTKNTKDRENYISEYIEKGTPVSIQFVELKIDQSSDKQRTTTSTTNNSDLDSNESMINSGSIENDIDLKKSLNRLFKDNIPCCNLIAQIVRRKVGSSSRGERGTLRLFVKNLKTSFEPKPGVYGVKGYLIVIKGRIGGSERSRILRYRSGPRPRHTVSAAIDYGFSEINTVSGQISLTIMAYFSK